MEGAAATANHRRLRLVLIDDDLNSLEVMLNTLSQHHEVFDFLRAGDALRMLREGDPVVDVIMVDVHVPGEKRDANFLIHDICHEFGRRLPIVMLSDVPGASATLGKHLEGSFLILKKPLDDWIFDTLTSFVSYKAAPGSVRDVAVSVKKRKNSLWNDELHQSFLRAADAEGGLDRAKPSAVLRGMLLDEGNGFKGLSRDQVASHLENERKKAKVVEN